MDICDIANDRADLFRKLALDKAMKRDHEPPLIIDDVRCCLDCEEPISEQRLIHMPDAVRCVECQAIREKV